MKFNVCTYVYQCVMNHATQPYTRISLIKAKKGMDKRHEGEETSGHALLSTILFSSTNMK